MAQNHIMYFFHLSEQGQYNERVECPVRYTVLSQRELKLAGELEILALATFHKIK